jgi:hypothetical protein
MAVSIRSEARGMLRVNTERRFIPRFKKRGLAPSNVSIRSHSQANSSQAQALFIKPNLDNIIIFMIVNKRSLREAEEADLEDWKSMTPGERLDVLQLLRELYYEFKNETRKGFQRVYRIVKQK